jgi:4-hydroxy-3-polyprenylbenzoate decarboxylase
LSTAGKDGQPKRLIVGISGASGIVFGIRMLEVLKQLNIETHLIISKAAEMTLAYESDLKAKDLREMANEYHPMTDIGANISSGSYKTIGMIIVPCSVRTMSEIASGVTGSLMSRAADVALKDRRRLVLAVRETPLHTGHLRTMTQLSEMGAIIAPIMPAFYNRPKTLEDIIDHTVGRLLDLFDIDAKLLKRWKEDGDPLIE